MSKKLETMKLRGIRFPKAMWGLLLMDAEKEKSTPSDLVRRIIAAHYSGSRLKTKDRTIK